MELTIAQQDSLTELINIGYGRAASALSDLTGHRIDLEVPKVVMHEIHEISPILSSVVSGEVASVTQIFSGPIGGNALLLLDEQAALMLSRLLTDVDTGTSGLDTTSREIITEVGNIVLNACLGVFGNLLQVQVAFAVPRLRVEGVEAILQSIVVNDEELRYALMIHTRFYLRAGNVRGYLVIILGITSLDRLLEEVTKWEERQRL